MRETGSETMLSIREWIFHHVARDLILIVVQSYKPYSAAIF